MDREDWGEESNSDRIIRLFKKFLSKIDKHYTLADSKKEEDSNLRIAKAVSSNKAVWERLKDEKGENRSGKPLSRRGVPFKLNKLTYGGTTWVSSEDNIVDISHKTVTDKKHYDDIMEFFTDVFVNTMVNDVIAPRCVLCNKEVNIWTDRNALDDAECRDKLYEHLSVEHKINLDRYSGKDSNDVVSWLLNVCILIEEFRNSNKDKYNKSESNVEITNQ